MGNKSVFKARVISSGTESSGCVFNFKIPTNFKSLYRQEKIHFLMLFLINPRFTSISCWLKNAMEIWK